MIIYVWDLNIYFPYLWTYLDTKDTSTFSYSTYSWLHNRTLDGEWINGTKCKSNKKKEWGKGYGEGILFDGINTKIEWSYTSEVDLPHL